VLGTLFEQQLRVKIGTEFRDRIATPIQMEDFRLETCTTSAGHRRPRSSSNHSTPPSLPNDGKGHGAVRLPVPPRRRVERTAIGSRGLGGGEYYRVFGHRRGWWLWVSLVGERFPRPVAADLERPRRAWQVHCRRAGSRPCCGLPEPLRVS
jgi:hypothetical protein